MNWQAPACTEIKMDAEIGSYQTDDDREWPTVVRNSTSDHQTESQET